MISVPTQAQTNERRLYNTPPETMDPSRAEPHIEGCLQSRVRQLENECSELQQECKILRQANSVLLQSQLEGEDKLSRLEEENDVLKLALNKAERKAEYQDMVVKNEHWEYPHELPNTDELLSFGFNRRESHGIVSSITEMKNMIMKMRRGEIIFDSLGGKSIYFPPLGHYYWDTSLPYYEGLLPHYKQFVDALVEYRQTIEHYGDEFLIRVGDASLPREVLDMLQEALKQTHFHSLDFRGNEIGGLGYIYFISTCVASDTRLKNLLLLNFTFEHSNDVDIFCQAVNSHNSLQKLTLEHISFESPEQNFGEIMKKLKSKTIEEISICDRSIPGILSAEFLQSNPSLKKLTFFDNPFSDEDLVHVQTALQSNTTLCQLRFEIDALPNTWRRLVSLVFDCTSLNAAYDSNHCCCLEGFLTGNSIHRKYFNSGTLPGWNRRKKIYTILSMRNANRHNAAYFESDRISIKHLPQILSILKPFSEHTLHNEDDDIGDHDDVKPLSIVYEIMRDWKMPELYNLALDE